MNNAAIRSYVPPAKKPAIIIRRKEDVQKLKVIISPLLKNKKEKSPPVKKKIPVLTKQEISAKLRKSFCQKYPDFKEYINKLSNVHPFLVTKALQNMKWSVDFAIEKLDNTDKIFEKWFYFYLCTSYLAGHDYIRSKISNGETLYTVINEFSKLSPDKKKLLVGGRNLKNSFLCFPRKKKVDKVKKV